MKLPLSVIILTYNEEIHLGRLMKNISDWADPEGNPLASYGASEIY